MRSLFLFSCLAAGALTGASPTFAQRQEKAFCLQSPGAARNCVYDSFEQCQQALGGRSIGGGCIANPAPIGTTGRGGLDAPRGTGPHSLDRQPSPVR